MIYEKRFQLIKLRLTLLLAECCGAARASGSLARAGLFDFPSPNLPCRFALNISDIDDGLTVVVANYDQNIDHHFSGEQMTFVVTAQKFLEFLRNFRVYF